MEAAAFGHYLVEISLKAQLLFFLFDGPGHYRALKKDSNASKR